MLRLRLLADDLTGALDTAAGFAGSYGPIPVVWPEVLPPHAAGSLVIDTGTRERSAAEAAATVAALAPWLNGEAGNDGIAFKKVDSLLRGPWAAELASVMGAGGWSRCIVAPAFPYQGRVTRGGRQFIREGRDWAAVSGEIAAALRDAGLPASSAAVADGPVSGVAVYDAESDADLYRIAGLRGDGRTLWCGSGGLAAALAGEAPAAAEVPLMRPVLGLFGSDRPETEAQLAACDRLRLVLQHGAAVVPEFLTEQLTRDGAVLVSLHLPTGMAREAAAVHIAERFAAVVAGVQRPGTLLVAGGETLKALCLALEVRNIDVTGQVTPGLPRSILRGGRWDGLPVLSKSGAFGRERLWRDLLDENGIILNGSGA